jgi:hypothetical protein
MKRHVIVGRFGGGDREKIVASADETATRLELVSANRRLDHGISRAMNDLTKIGVYPSEIGLDLLILAAHIHAADTRISRDTESQDSWTRELRIVVPVSDPPRWNAAVDLLQRMLNFLTGDVWAIGFRARPASFAAIVRLKPAALVLPPYNGVSLFSGGLDSLIGAIDVLEDGETPLLVSHAGEGAVSKSQTDCFDALAARYANRGFNRCRLWMNFKSELVRRVASEDTTRGRSFLFFALGIFAGTGIGRPFTLRVPENGFIALNVPLDPLRLGALSTRTTHPFYMARWNELLNQLGIPGRVDNPYWDKTKGEMVAACRNTALLRQIAPLSISCSSPGKMRWMGKSQKHCGYCLPCLIRRGAFGRRDPTAYALSDLTAQELNSKKAEGEQVRSFQFAIQRLANTPGLAKVLIHQPGPLTDEPARHAALASVYERGLNEVGRILNGVRTRPA